MELTFPVFVQVIKRDGVKAPIHRAQLLFENGFCAEDEFLQRALRKLIRLTKKNLDELGRSWNHQPLANLIFNDNFQTKRMKLDLDLRQRMVRVRYFWVLVPAFERYLVFTPTIPDLWFDVQRSENLKARATEVLEKRFRPLNKSNVVEADKPESYAVTGEAWITEIDIDVRLEQASQKESTKKLLALWSDEEMDGNTELYRVGRCLDTLYPDDLDRAIGREQEAKQIARLLSLKDRRPILLVGESLVGKTAIVHEVTRLLIQKKKKQSSKNNLWLISPQRLISGMSYVGQWENRLLSILKESKKRNHILYFDDILGLFRAGKSSDSDLCVADLLKTSLYRREVCVIGEITPSGHDALLNLDRGFADLFQVVFISPTDVTSSLRIAIDVARDQELKQGCQFFPDALPTVMQLTRQYARHAAFPGKAAKFIRQISLKFHDKKIARREVLDEFRATTGISTNLVDDRQVVDRESVLKFFNQRLIGQDHAIQACADVIAMAKARLNNQSKPLATMLFLGPTGVGKTECAKTLTEFLFGSAERLLRFDLNEFKSAYSASRLVGTREEPEGLLTSAVRQRPFNVILFDEIEKAHPDVFDMLLQVTGEGRLTDAYGRTADFTNSVIVMTSNLGTGSLSSSVGFQPGHGNHRFVRAAQAFFRPEFFNRIDRVLPFEPLTRKQIARIAELMMQRVVSREGLVRRRCILRVNHVALTNVVTKGYHAEWGARAMKRAIEQEFTQPVSARLAAIQSDVPTVIQISGKSSGDFKVDVRPLENVVATRGNPTMDATSFLDVAEKFLNRIKMEHISQRPAGEISSRGLNPDLLRFFAIEEQFQLVQHRLHELRNALEEQIDFVSRTELPISGERRKTMRLMGMERRGVSSRRFLREINSVRDIRHFVDEQMRLASDQNGNTGGDSPLVRIVDECALLEDFTKSKADEAIFVMRTMGMSAELDSGLSKLNATKALALTQLFKEEFGFDVETRSSSGNDLFVFHIRGSCIDRIATAEHGAHLYCDSNGALSLIQTVNLPLTEENASAVDRLLSRKTIDSRAATATEEMVNQNASFHVLRLHDYDHRTIDFRTGQVNFDRLTGKRLRKFVLGGLHRPSEFRAK